jgi:hypothetical protein
VCASVRACLYVCMDACVLASITHLACAWKIVHRKRMCVWTCISDGKSACICTYVSPDIHVHAHELIIIHIIMWGYRWGHKLEAVFFHRFVKQSHACLTFFVCVHTVIGLFSVYGIYCWCSPPRTCLNQVTEFAPHAFNCRAYWVNAIALPVLGVICTLIGLVMYSHYRLCDPIDGQRFMSAYEVTLKCNKQTPFTTRWCEATVIPCPPNREALTELTRMSQYVIWPISYMMYMYSICPIS